MVGVPLFIMNVSITATDDMSTVEEETLTAILITEEARIKCKIIKICTYVHAYMYL